MCEDYPCCGHEIGDCYTTESQAERDARFYQIVTRMDEDDYYYDYP